MVHRLTCPKCKHEFPYDSDYIDNNITRLGTEISDINSQIAEYNCLPRDEQNKKHDWLCRVRYCLAQKSKELAELRSIRKAAQQQIKKYEFQVFKHIVREHVGESQFQKFIEKMEEELGDYKLKDMMKHEYSRSNSKTTAVNISKL